MAGNGWISSWSFVLKSICHNTCQMHSLNWIIIASTSQPDDLPSQVLPFSRQESEVRKNNNRIGGATVSGRYPKPTTIHNLGIISWSSFIPNVRKFTTLQSHINKPGNIIINFINFIMNIIISISSVLSLLLLTITPLYCIQSSLPYRHQLHHQHIISIIIIVILMISPSFITC